MRAALNVSLCAPAGRLVVLAAGRSEGRVFVDICPVVALKTTTWREEGGELWAEIEPVFLDGCDLMTPSDPCGGFVYPPHLAHCSWPPEQDAERLKELMEYVRKGAEACAR